MIGMAGNKESVGSIQAKKTPHKSPSAKNPQKMVPITNFFKPPVQKPEPKKDLFGYFKKVSKSPPGSENAKAESSSSSPVKNQSVSQEGKGDGSNKTCGRDVKTENVAKRKSKKMKPSKLEFGDNLSGKKVEPLRGEKVQTSGGSDDGDLEHEKVPHQKKSPPGNHCDGPNISFSEGNTEIQGLADVSKEKGNQKKRKIEQSQESSADDFEDVPASKKMKKKEVKGVKSSRQKRGSGRVGGDVDTSDKDLSKDSKKCRKSPVSEEKKMDNSDVEGERFTATEGKESGVGFETEPSAVHVSSGHGETSEQKVTDVQQQEDVELEVISYEQFLCSQLETSETETAADESRNKNNVEERSDAGKEPAPGGSREEPLLLENASNLPKVEPIPCGKTITTTVMIHGPPSPASSDMTDKSRSTNSPSPEGKHLRRKSNVVVDVTEVDLTVTEEDRKGGAKGATPQGPVKYHSFFTKQKPAEGRKQDASKAKQESSEPQKVKTTTAKKESVEEKSSLLVNESKSGDDSKAQESSKKSCSKKKQSGTGQQMTEQTGKDKLTTPLRKSARKNVTQSSEQRSEESQEFMSTEDVKEKLETPKRGRKRKSTVPESESETSSQGGKNVRKRKASVAATPRKKMALQKIFNMKSKSVESDSDFEKCQTPRTRSTRSKRQDKKELYKSVVVDTGPDKNSPIRLRLTKVNRSPSKGSSKGEDKKRNLTTRAAKKQTNVKATKAQELLHKARNKQLQKTATKSKQRGNQTIPSSGRKTLSTNKASKSRRQLVVTKVTEVIELGDSPEDAKSKQKKELPSINAVLGKKPAKIKPPARQKPTQSGTCGERKIATDNESVKKATPAKLAPIFANFGKKTAEWVSGDAAPEAKLQPVIIDESSMDSSQDDDGFLAKRDRLLSKMAAESAKKTLALKLDPAPWPTVSHVQQKEVSSSKFWSLAIPAAIGLARRDEINTRIDLSMAAGLMLGQLTLALEKSGFHLRENMVSKRPEFSYSVRKLLLQEIGKTDPNFPVNRWFKKYLAKRKGTSIISQSQANDNIKGTEKSEKTKEGGRSGKRGKRKPEVSDSGSETNPRKSSRRSSLTEENVVRRSSRRLQSKTVAEEMTKEKETKTEKDSQKKTDDKEKNDKNEMVDKTKDVLWTDKYQPTQSSEIIGNKETVRKLHSWLSEWKRRSDREKKQLKKQLKKEARKSKEKSDNKSDEWWYDDGSDFDISGESDSDYYDDEEDVICNTVLIQGPTGIGKTAAVYACAQELGFKVFEVNASSKRSGKQILSELKEATQSHQVSHGQGSGMLSKFVSHNVQVPGKEVKKPPVHSAFASFLKKPDSGGKKTKKKKESETKAGASQVVPQASTSSRMKIASTSLILFEEVDLIFEEDKGFWSAINTLMSTTKRPIVMTTSDSTFAVPIDECFLEYTFKPLSVSTVATNLQLICLAEDIRTDRDDIERLVELHNCDIRQCLLNLQFWAESGADRKLSGVDASEKTDQNSVDRGNADFPYTQESVMSCRTDKVKGQGSEHLHQGNDPMNSNMQEKVESADVEDETQDFEMQLLIKLIDMEIKTIVISEYYQGQDIGEPAERKKEREHNLELKDSQETKDSQDIVSSQEMSDLAIEGGNVNLPKVNCLSTESSLGLLNLTWKSGSLLQHLKDNSSHQSNRVSMVAAMRDRNKDLIRSNLHCLVQKQPCLETKPSKDGNVRKQNCDKKSEIVDESLQSWSEYLDNVSSADLLGFSKNVSNHCSDGSWWTATQSHGLSDQLTKCVDCDWLSEVTTRDLNSCFLVGSADRFCSQQRKLLQQAMDFYKPGDFEQMHSGHQHCEVSDLQDICDSLELVRKEDDDALKLSIWTQQQHRHSQQCKDSNTDACRVLPLAIQCNHRAITTDYIPAMRTLCKAEKHREETNMKRRFLHYLDSLNLKPSTLNVLAGAFAPESAGHN
ncbi:ATPase family AAA domain-containing protein 5-like isoform X2 [Ptychodera flava]|uniref:ATPase family AAA domain-containing protein 5-like isoform X2 n=1 Tax=Ptychodera flava TaxID=63121 RepID=UPI00396A7ED9